MDRVYTAEEVALHNTEADCWVIVGGRVLDVTAYLPKHPGGKQLVSRSAGQDVTRDFEAMFHSIRARQKLEELCIGRLASAGPSQFLAPWQNGGSSKQGTRALNAAAGPGRGPYGLGPPQSGVVTVPSKRAVRLTKDGWTSLTLVKERGEGPECKVLTFALPNNGLLGVKPSQHVRVRLRELVRSYTPVAWSKAGSFELLVKSYAAPAGVMSRHLCGMATGQEIEFNGPCGEFVWEQKKGEAAGEHVVLAGMGTGATPLVQLLHGMQESDWSRGKKVRATLLMAYASEAHVLLAKQLHELAALAGPLLRVQYFYSTAGQRLTPSACAEVLGDASMVCVCGTDQFVASFREAVPAEKPFHAF